MSSIRQQVHDLNQILNKLAKEAAEIEKLDQYTRTIEKLSDENIDLRNAIIILTDNLDNIDDNPFKITRQLQAIVDLLADIGLDVQRSYNIAEIAAIRAAIAEALCFTK